MIPVSRETAVPWLVGFTEQVVVHPKYDVCSTEPFAKWDKAPTTAKGCLVTTRLDMIYSFGIRDTCYKVELMSMWYPGQKIPVWGLGIRHIQWEEHLALLENLAIGERAEWGSTIETFFPKDGVYSSYSGGSADDLSVGDLSLNSESGQSSNDGLEIFMEKLLQISGLVSSVTQGDGAPV